MIQELDKRQKYYWRLDVVVGIIFIILYVTNILSFLAVLTGGAAYGAIVYYIYKEKKKKISDALRNYLRTLDYEEFNKAVPLIKNNVDALRQEIIHKYGGVEEYDVILDRDISIMNSSVYNFLIRKMAEFKLNEFKTIGGDYSDFKVEVVCYPRIKCYTSEFIPYMQFSDDIFLIFIKLSGDMFGDEERREVFHKCLSAYLKNQQFKDSYTKLAGDKCPITIKYMWNNGGKSKYVV